MPPKEKLGEAQLEILRFVQDRGTATVRDVAAFLSERRGLTRTTALNAMERLREKGYLWREQADGVYRYAPVQSKASLLKDLVRDFVTKSLGGSLEPFVAYLAEEAHLTEEERRRLDERVSQLRENGVQAGNPASVDPAEDSK